jgi:hypothetical protein
MRYYYDYGLPFGKALTITLDTLQKRIFENNKSSFIVVDGAVGSGKTIFSIQIADYINGAYNTNDGESWTFDQNKAIDLKDQYAMGNKEFLKKLMICYKKKLRVLIYDEAGDFSRRGSLTKINADLNRAFEVCRMFKVLVIMVLPNFFYLDRSIFDKEMIRAVFRITRETNEYANFRLWDMIGFNLIKHYTTKIPIPSQGYSIVKPIMRGHTLNLAPERDKILQEISAKSKSKIIKNMVDADVTKYMTAKMISVENGVGKVIAYNFIKDYGIKVAKVDGITQYFNRADVEKIIQKYGIGKLK